MKIKKQVKELIDDASERRKFRNKIASIREKRVEEKKTMMSKFSDVVDSYKEFISERPPQISEYDFKASLAQDKKDQDETNIYRKNIFLLHKWEYIKAYKK